MGLRLASAGAAATRSAARHPATRPARHRAAAVPARHTPAVAAAVTAGQNPPYPPGGPSPGPGQPGPAPGGPKPTGPGRARRRGDDWKPKPPPPPLPPRPNPPSAATRADRGEVGYEASIWAGALFLILVCAIGLVVGGDALITEIKGW